MAIVGYVTKAFGSIQTATRIDASIPFKANLVNGRFLGQFGSVRGAQIEIEKAAGRILRWIVEDREDGIESYRGEEVIL